MSFLPPKDNEAIVTEYTATSPSYQVFSPSYDNGWETAATSPLKSPQSPHSPMLNIKTKLAITKLSKANAKRAITRKHTRAELDDTDVIESRKLNPTLFKPKNLG